MFEQQNDNSRCPTMDQYFFQTIRKRIGISYQSACMSSEEGGKLLENLKEIKKRKK